MTEPIGQVVDDDPLAKVAGSWAADEVMKAVNEAAPEPVPKAQLQELAGAGASDMRDALQDLIEREEIIETEGGYALFEPPMEGVIGQPQIDPDGAEPDDDADDPDDVEDEPVLDEGDDDDIFGDDEPSDAPGASTEGNAPAPPVESVSGDGRPRYVATLAVEVSFYVKATGEQGDAEAFGDAQELLKRLEAVVAEEYPGVSSTAFVSGVEVFQRARVLRLGPGS